MNDQVKLKTYVDGMKMEDELLRKQVIRHIDSTTKMLEMMKKLSDQVVLIAQVNLAILERVLALETRNKMIDLELKKLVDSHG
jgi:hypothetical protein